MKKRSFWILVLAIGLGSVLLLLVTMRRGPNPLLYVTCENQVLLCWDDLVLYDHEFGGLPATLGEAVQAEVATSLVCPVREHSGGDGYEYAGMGMKLQGIAGSAVVPLVFDRQGNHPNHTRTVASAGWDDPQNRPVRLMQEDDFRKVLVQAIRSGAYPAATVEKLKKDEPWVAKELGGD